MYRRFFLGIFAVIVIFLPSHIINAQTAKERYCPDPAKDFFKGSIYHTDDGKPWIEVKVDPKFEQEELRGKRKITGDIPLTPVYDLVVRIKPEFNYYCIKNWTAGVGEVLSKDLPKNLPIKGFITIGSNGEVIAGPGIFQKTDKKDEQNRFIYEWKLKGWQKGIAVSQKLERLVQAIAQNQPVDAMVEIKPPRDKTLFYEKSPQTFDSCVPIGGGGTHHIIGMYTSNSLAVDQRVSHFDAVRSTGFAVIEPLATYQPEFAYFVDLKSSETATKDPNDPVSEIGRLKRPPSGEILKYTPELHNKALMNFIGHSTCQGKGILLLTASKDYENGVALLKNTNVQGAIIGNGHAPKVYVHEFLHTFAGLNDEYEYEVRADKHFPISLTNCSLEPDNDYRLDSVLYGNKNDKGCSYLYQDTPDNVPKQYYYKPSSTSFMASGGPVVSLNIPSCAFAILAIKNEEITKENAKKYFPECAKMKGIITDGVVAQNVLAPVLGWFDNVMVPPESLIAQAIQTASGTKVKVIVPENRTPPAEFVALNSTEAKQIKSPDACLDATAKGLFNKKQQPFRADLEESWKKEAKCAQDISDATTLEQKNADFAESIRIIQNYIDAITLSSLEIKNLTTLDGTSFSIIPAGEKQEKIYLKVGSILLKCVANSSVPLGTILSNKANIYVSTSSEIETKIAGSKKTNADYYTAFVKESAKYPDTVTNATLNRLITLKEMLKSDFSLMSKGAISKHFTSLEKENVIPLSVKIIKDAGGKTKECKPDTFAGIQLGALKVKGDNVGKFISGNVTVGDKVYQKDCIPEAYLLKELKIGMEKSLAYYQKLKVEYETQLKQTTSELETLRTAGYNCASPIVVAVGVPVRKSSGGQRAPTVPQSPLSESSGQSYLIVESFDPDDPWGEIIEIVSDEEDNAITPDLADTNNTEETPTSPKPGRWEGITGFAGDVWNGVTGFAKNVWQGAVGLAGDVAQGIAGLFGSGEKEPILALNEPAGRAAMSAGSTTQIPVRELTLDTLGKTLFLISDGYAWDSRDVVSENRDGQLIEQINGVDAQKWEVKYEHKGSSRRICEPPVFNVSFKKKDKNHPLRKFFNGRTTYQDYSELGYQKIRFISECDLWNDYGPWGSDVGFSGASNVLLREYLIHNLFRQFGIPASDVIGFARVHFVSSDSKYNDKEFRYLMIQRTDEPDDQIPFIKQFNLSPDLYVSGPTSPWGGNLENEKDYALSRLVSVNLKNYSTGEKIVLPLDQKEAVIMSIMTDFFNLSDMGVIHNEDYGMDLSTKKYYIIPHGFDASFSCDIRDPSLGYMLNDMPSDIRSNFKTLYYNTAREIFTNPASLARMLSAVNAYPFNDGKEKMREFLKLSFFHYAKYVTSQNFAELTGQAYAPTKMTFPFVSEEEYSNHLDAFQKTCSRQFITLNKDVVSVVGTPRLEKNHSIEQTEKDEQITAFFNVNVKAGNKELRVLKKEAFNIKLEDTAISESNSPKKKKEEYENNNRMWLYYGRPSNLEDSIGPYYFIPPHTSAVFEVVGKTSSMNFENNTYTAVLSSFQPFSSAIPITLIANNRTNVLTFGDKEPVPVITVLSPNEEETKEWIKGQTYTIRWNANTSTVMVDLIQPKNSVHPEYEYHLTHPNGDIENIGSLQYQVPLDMPSANDYQIRVMYRENGVQKAVGTSSAFAIVSPITLSKLNLSVAKPWITSIMPAGKADTHYESEMTFNATIQNKGEAITKTFGNTIQYRNVKSGGDWVDWVKFEIAKLEVGGEVSIGHSWKGVAGEWEFRLVGNSTGAPVYSEAARVSIIARAGEIVPPEPPALGTPVLLLYPPTIKGEQAGEGKIYAGGMSIYEKVTNIGDGMTPPFQILFLYSQDGENWSDWVRLDFSKLAPAAERSVFYGWKGNPGKWHFKACEDIKDTCSLPIFVEVIPI